MKNEKGITLIALVITIIVMLILVVVTVTFALGDDGIIGNARAAKTAQESASIKEAVGLAKADIIAGKYTNTTGYESMPDASKIKAEIIKYVDDDNLKAKLVVDSSDINDDTITVNGSVVTINLEKMELNTSDEDKIITIDLSSTYPATPDL